MIHNIALVFKRWQALFFLSVILVIAEFVKSHTCCCLVAGPAVGCSADCSTDLGVILAQQPCQHPPCCSSFSRRAAAGVLIRERELAEQKVVLGAFSLGAWCPDSHVNPTGSSDYCSVGCKRHEPEDHWFRDRSWM